MATVSSGNKTGRFRFIREHGRTLGVRYLCDWLNVSPSGYYDWLKRKESKRSIEDKAILKRIRQIHEDTMGIYGSPRIYKKLRAQGARIGRKRVERLMNQNDIKGRVVLVTRRQPGLKYFQQSGHNLRLDMEMPTTINQQWVADITFIDVKGKWKYLIAIMDLYSRRIIGWSLCNNRKSHEVHTLLKKVIAKRKPPANLIFHTDRGVEFIAYNIQDLLKKHEIKRSVNRAGYCTDNAHMESFFHSLKTEYIRGRKFESFNHLNSSLNRYINNFYNNNRMHSGINYHSPRHYERMIA